MATFTVTTLIDEENTGATMSAPGGQGLSLREAITLANASAGADRIEFADDLSGLMRMAGSQINIRDEVEIDGGGRITISGDVANNDRTVAGDISTLAGNGVAQLGDNVRAFFVRDDADTTLIGLTLTGGRTRNEGGHGGFIYSQSDLTLIDSLVSGNSTSADNAKGGGLFSRTSITLTNSTVTDNSTTGEDSDGGAIAVDALDAAGTITITDSEISGSLTTGRYASGGGVYSDGALTITNSVINNNRTTGYNGEGGGTASLGEQVLTGSRIADNFTTNTFSEGGGAFSAGALTIADSTIAGNKTSGRSSEGGGVYSKGKLVVNSSSITGNTTTDRNAEGGGVYAGFFKNEITGSVISGNSTSGDFSSGGSVSSGGDLYLINTTISGNSTNGLRADGGGVRGGDIYLINSTISGNQTLGEDSDGGGAATRSIRLSAENSIVLGNKVLTGDGDELAQGNSPFSTGALTLTGQNIIGSGDGALSDSLRINDQSTGTSQYADPIAVFGLTNGADGFVKGLFNNNGGPVQTISLNSNPDNPALNSAGEGATAADARGIVAADGRDLGAYELITDANLIVTTTDDVLDANDGQMSLREAIDFANAIEGANTITFAAGVEGMIRLTEGEIQISDDLTVEGGGRITVTGDANGDDIVDADGITDVTASSDAGLLDDNSPIFYAVGRSTDLTVDGLTLTGGRSEAESAGGGAIRANGAAVILNSTISGNSTTGEDSGGGGVYAMGSLTITDSTISRNVTTGNDAEGGGVFGMGPTTITRSTITENQTQGSEGYGAGIFADDSLTLAHSTVAYNVVSGPNGYGAGLYSSNGDVLITHSTIVGNMVTQPTTDANFVAGPGVYVDGPLTINNSIIVGNTAASGGPEISREGDEGVIAFTGFNIIGSDAGAYDANGLTNVINASPSTLFAGTLADNGGPVQTIALKADRDNPALDAAASTDTDARVLPRVDLDFINNGGVADLGAFELQDQFLFAPTITSAAAVNVVEGRTAVTAITANDDQGGVRFAITGGADAARFAINSVTGGLTFKAAPDFDAPTDMGVNNVYNIEITATDSDGLSARQALAITVSETPSPTAPTGPTLGDDTLFGTAQNDTINALAGDDNVSGLAGDDLLLGGGGDDSIKGAAGDDRLRGNGGEDTLKGGGGDDNLKGNGGEDVIRGNGGNDVVRAGGGADNVKGGGGADLIFGGGGADQLNGGGGADTLRGNGGDDTLKGNGGADVFQFRASDRNDTISDFRQGQDKIQIQSGANSFEALSIEQDGRDVLIGFGAGQVRVVTDNAGAFDESDFIF